MKRRGLLKLLAMAAGALALGVSRNAEMEPRTLFIDLKDRRLCDLNRTGGNAWLSGGPIGGTLTLHAGDRSWTFPVTATIRMIENETGFELVAG